jgi:hypothetical protein
MIRGNNKYGFVQSMNAVALLIIFSFSLSLIACSSSETPPLQTQEFFTSRVNDGGKTQFAFGLTWEMQQGMREEQSGQEARQRVRDDSPQFSGRDRGVGRYQLDKQIKLQLEEQAAEKLQAQIDRRELCENGHKVEQVIWEVGRIRLMGHCL